MKDAAFWKPDSDVREKIVFFLYENISGLIERYASRITGAQLSDEMAWIARSLLELEIWAEYCNASEEKAQQFWQDSIRDLQELTRHFDDTPDSANLILELEMTTHALTGTRRRDKPIYAATASREIGREGYLKEQTAALSKLLHPTSLSIGLLSNPEGESKIRDAIAIAAVEYAKRAREKLSTGYTADVYAKFRPYFERARQKRKDATTK
jgi:hypothetical protein